MTMKRLLPIALLLAACSGSSSGPELVPDFLLADVNPNSPTGGQDVSPRDYVGLTSAYYFGAAT
jgi:hypothetical protein